MNENEFDSWYASSYSRILAQVYAMVGSRDEAEECVQEAFARAWQHRRSLSHDGHPDAWVRTCAYRLAVSRWRKFGRRRGHGQVETPVVAPSDDRVVLVSALRQLPESQRRAVVLHHLADLSVDDVAAETGAPVGTVKARLSRGRAALAALLSEPEPPTSVGGSHV
ncbi:MAG: SigE family RNA polymerase sigma factor [Nocardioides sp.]